MYNDGNETFQKVCARYAFFFFASFLVSVVVMVALSSLVAFPRNTTISPEKPTIWLKTRDEIDVRRYTRDTPVVEWKRPYSKKKKKQMLNNLVFKNLFIG